MVRPSTWALPRGGQHLHRVMCGILIHSVCPEFEPLRPYLPPEPLPPDLHGLEVLADGSPHLRGRHTSRRSQLCRSRRALVRPQEPGVYLEQDGQPHVHHRLRHCRGVGAHHSDWSVVLQNLLARERRAHARASFRKRQFRAELYL